MVFAGLTGTTLTAFALTSFLIELTPGPNMAWLAILTVSEGRRRGYAAVAGVALGLALVGVAAAVGLAALITESPLAYQALRWTGVLYLLWLAWDGWRGDGEPQDHGVVGSDLGPYFRRGLLTNMLNPKAAVFYLAVVPTFSTAQGPILGESLVLSLIYVSVATTVHASIVTLAGWARTWLTDRDRERRVRRVLSLMLAGVALWFAWKTA